jgi:copper chaperone CopZ
MKVHKFLFVLLLISFSAFGKVTVKYDVPEMVCESCVKMITTHLIKRRGLAKEQIKFNIEKKQVDITFPNDKDLSKDDLKYLLLEAGYELVKSK